MSSGLFAVIAISIVILAVLSAVFLYLHATLVPDPRPTCMDELLPALEVAPYFREGKFRSALEVAPCFRKGEFRSEFEVAPCAREGELRPALESWSRADFLLRYEEADERLKIYRKW